MHPNAIVMTLLQISDSQNVIIIIKVSQIIFFIFSDFILAFKLFFNNAIVFLISLLRTNIF